MVIMQTPLREWHIPLPANSLGQTLAGEMLRIPISAITHGQPPVTSTAPIEFEAWQEDDQSWAAQSQLLGITAVAETLEELSKEIPEVVADFWALLEERHATLSPELRSLLHSKPTYLTIRPIPRP